MFARRISIERVDASGQAHACPIRWIDNFAMRNFTNDAVFDDTLPAGDGLLEAGHRVPLDRLATAMEDWFRRKGYLKADEQLEVRELTPDERGCGKGPNYDANRPGKQPEARARNHGAALRGGSNPCLPPNRVLPAAPQL